MFDRLPQTCSSCSVTRRQDQQGHVTITVCFFVFLRLFTFPHRDPVFPDLCLQCTRRQDEMENVAITVFVCSSSSDCSHSRIVTRYSQTCACSAPDGRTRWKTPSGTGDIRSRTGNPRKEWSAPPSTSVPPCGMRSARKCCSCSNPYSGRLTLLIVKREQEEDI